MQLPEEAWNGAEANGHYDKDAAFGRYQRRHAEPELEPNGAEHDPAVNGQELNGRANGFVSHDAQEPADRHGIPSPELVAEEPLYAHAPARAAAGSPMLGSLRRAWARLLPGRQNRRHEVRAPRWPEPGIEPERIANRFARSRNGA
jgi:hypothetical protein